MENQEHPHNQENKIQNHFSEQTTNHQSRLNNNVSEAEPSQIEVPSQNFQIEKQLIVQTNHLTNEQPGQQYQQEDSPERQILQIGNSLKEQVQNNLAHQGVSEQPETELNQNNYRYEQPEPIQNYDNLPQNQHGQAEETSTETFQQFNDADVQYNQENYMNNEQNQSVPQEEQTEVLQDRQKHIHVKNQQENSSIQKSNEDTSQFQVVTSKEDVVKQTRTQIEHQESHNKKQTLPNQFTVYQNQVTVSVKMQQKPPNTSESPAVNIQQKQQKSSPKQKQKSQIQQPTVSEVDNKYSKKKKSKKKKMEQESEPLPIITAESNTEQVNKQGIKKVDNQHSNQQRPQVSSNNMPNANNGEGSGGKKPVDKITQQRVVQSQTIVQKQQENFQSKNQPQVSQIIEPTSSTANIIILQAQRQRIGTTFEYFIKFLTKHQKHTKNQKQLIKNVEEEIQKKRISKQIIFNALKDYFSEYASMSKQFYQKSYKFSKNDKIFSLNPLINMKEELKVGIDELIFLRKSTGNQFHRMSDFVINTIQKAILKTFMEYWANVTNAQNKHKQKRDQFHKKEKQFMKRISKVQKVYTKGKQGVPQQQDLFIEMAKFIHQQRQYRQYLVEYGLSLIPLKKSFIKAEQTLYQQLQVIFNNFKNQTRNVYSLHVKQFTHIQRFQKQIKQNNTFEKLSDITDADYVRSVLVSYEKNSIPVLTDKQFEKVLNMVYFQEVVGNATDLLKGTTSKSFQLKNKAEQVVDTISGNLVIFNKQTAQMKEKFVIKNINAKIVNEGVVEIDQVLKGLIFDSNRTVRITFRDNDRAEELICFLNQIQESQVLDNKK